MILTGLGGLFLIAWPPAAWLVSQPLESGYPKSPPAIGDAEAIVVLSSSIVPAAGGRPEAAVGPDTFDRCACAMWLYRRGKPVPLLAAGGSSSDVPTPAALLMRQTLIAMGIPESMIWVEDRSHSTYENALYSAGILREKGVHRIALVTEAYHMPRAERCFRKQGLSVIPAPCRAHVWESAPSFYIPDGVAILENEDSLHEYVGLIWYAVRGRI